MTCSVDEKDLVCKKYVPVTAVLFHLLCQLLSSLRKRDKSARCSLNHIL